MTMDEQNDAKLTPSVIELSNQSPKPIKFIVDPWLDVYTLNVNMHLRVEQFGSEASFMSVVLSSNSLRIQCDTDCGATIWLDEERVAEHAPMSSREGAALPWPPLKAITFGRQYPEHLHVLFETRDGPGFPFMLDQDTLIGSLADDVLCWLTVGYSRPALPRFILATTGLWLDAHAKDVYFDSLSHWK